MKFSKKAIKRYYSKSEFLSIQNEILDDLSNIKNGRDDSFDNFAISLPKERTNKNCIKFIAEVWSVKPKDIKKLIRLREIDDWLKLAMGENDEAKGIDFSTEFEGKGFRFSTNRCRMHIAKSENPLKIGQNIVPTEMWENETITSITIHPKFLIEALQIFADDNEIVIGISKGGNWVGNVSDDKGPKLSIKGVGEKISLAAWIMGIKWEY